MLDDNGKHAHLDPYTDLIVPGDAKETISFCVEHFLSAYRESIEDHGAFYVALSGGSTPKAIFEKITASPIKEKIDWTLLHLFWSDERSVPPTSTESNYHMAMNAGFAKVPIPEKNIHRMHAENNISDMALAYEREIKHTLQGKGFDYVMLGMGEDGHTASLFPSTAGLSEESRLVTANFVPQKDTWRMTFTYPCINKARHIVIYVIGQVKKTTLHAVLKKEKHFVDYPIVKVGTKEHKALYICDKDAAELILEEIE